MERQSLHDVPAGQDPREALGTLWYHDHRADFTAQNVYKGLAGMALFFDEQDSGFENDPNPDAFRLPSGDHDVPMIFADKKFASTPDHALEFDVFNTNGILGDQYTSTGRASRTSRSRSGSTASACSTSVRHASTGSRCRTASR